MRQNWLSNDKLREIGYGIASGYDQSITEIAPERDVELVACLEQRQEGIAAVAADIAALCRH